MDKLKFFLKLSIRQLFVNKRFSVINIIGLSVGLTITLLILLYVGYETSFDQFNPNAGNIYRIVRKDIREASIAATTPVALSDVLKKDFPELDKVIGLIETWDDIKVEGDRFNNLNGAIVEKDFFELFNFPIVQGNGNSLFLDPYEAVITHKLAKQLFGTANPIGETLEYEDHLFTITGLINNIPSNSIFDFDYFLSDKFRYISYPDLSERWYEQGLYAFVTFKGNTLPEKFEDKLKGIEERYYPDFMKNRHHYQVTSFEGSHLNPTLENDFVPAVAPQYLWILLAIAIGVLVIACLNFINISIANASKRNIETGIKKVNGAAQGSLVLGFFTEISIVVLISLGLSFFLAHLLLPSFSHLVEKDIRIDFFDPTVFIGAVVFGVITILISGLYPSIVLSRPSPVQIFLQRKESARKRVSFQKSFIILQFAITIILCTGLLFMFKQVAFMQNHEVGFNRQNLISMPSNNLGSDHTEQLQKATRFVEALEKYQAQYGFSKASVTEFIPGFGYRNQFKIYPQDDPLSEGMELLSCDVDENYLEVFGLQMLQGRFFSNDFTGDYESAILINETACKRLGWTSIDGKYVGLFSKDNVKKVIGIVNDINLQSLQHPIQPMIYQFGRHHNYPGYITVRVNPENKAESINFFKTQWEGLFPGVPFEFESVDEKYMSAYGEEIKLSKITSVFSLLALLLSLLGIFALSTLETEKRSKEIGVRKVNGAKVRQVMLMLNKSFIQLIIIAFLIASPVAWYAMHKWLQSFAYKTPLSWWIFAAGGVITMLIALLTVSWQSWKAATRNPVEALRYE